MTTTIQYVKKVGGSLMVRIPKEIARLEQIAENQPIEIDIHKLKKDCFGALQGLASMQKKEKLDIHG